MFKKKLFVFFFCVTSLYTFTTFGKNMNHYITVPITVSHILSVKEVYRPENFNLSHESTLTPSLGIGIGYYLNDNSRMDLLYEALNFQFNEQNANFSFVEDDVYIQGTKAIKRRVFGNSLRLNYYYNILKRPSLTIFAGAGIGCVQLKESKTFFVSGHFIDNGNLRSFPSSVNHVKSKKTTNFSHSLMVGISKKFNSIWHWDLTYSWRDDGKIKNNNISNRYRGHHFSTGLRFDL